MKIRAAFALTAATFGFGLALAGCASIPDAHPLSGSVWMLTRIDTSGSTTTLDPALQSRHRLAFDEGGAAQVRLDCNRGSSTWTAGQPRSGAGAISFGPIASTKMLCPEPSFGDDMARGLAAAERYIISMEARQLVIETPELRLTFAPADW